MQTIPKHLTSTGIAASNAEAAVPYPPGIPFVCPGEVITQDIVTYIKALREEGEKVIGVNDRKQVLVGKPNS